MSGQLSRGSAGEYQADEQAGVVKVSVGGGLEGNGQTLNYVKLVCNLTAEFSFPGLALFLQLSTLLNIQFRDGFLSIKYSKC